MISVIIVARNEGLELEATIGLVAESEPAPGEIIVVDDQNEPPLGERLAGLMAIAPVPIRVVRTAMQIGPGPAKRFGAEHATGDLLIILDAHMRMPTDWLEVIQQASVRFPDALLCTTCQGTTVKSPPNGCGAYYESGAEHALAFGRRWYARRETTLIDTVPCILGACYAIPRHIWSSLGGINPNFEGWGFGEQDLSLRAWLSGFECRGMNNLVVQHRFAKKESPRKHGAGKGGMVSWRWRDLNEMVLAATVFEDGVFERLYEPFMRRLYSKHVCEAFDAKRASIEEFRSIFQAKRTEPDASLAHLCGYRLPSEKEQETAVGKVRAARSAPPSIRPAQRRLKPDVEIRDLERIVARLSSRGRMLEWGSGGSTHWIRERLYPEQLLHSVEHDPVWAKRVGDVILAELPGIKVASRSCEARWRELEASEYASIPWWDDQDEPFDVILVDGVVRQACLASIVRRRLVKRSGRVFLHDANRDWYSIPDGLIPIQESEPDRHGRTMLELRLAD